MIANEKNAAAIERARTLQNVPWCEEYELMIYGMPYVSFCPIALFKRITGRYGLDTAPGSLQRWKTRGRALQEFSETVTRLILSGRAATMMMLFALEEKSSSLCLERSVA